MATSSQYSFEYEALISSAAEGALSGSAVSVQGRNGDLPGLAGANPTLRVVGDRLCFESQPDERRRSDVWAWLLVLRPPAHNFWLDRQMKRASVRSIEVSIVGLRAVLAAGQTVRVKLEFDPNTGAGTDPVANVSLFEGQRLLREWTAVPVEYAPL